MDKKEDERIIKIAADIEENLRHLPERIAAISLQMQFELRHADPLGILQLEPKILWPHLFTDPLGSLSTDAAYPKALEQPSEENSTG